MCQEGLKRTTIVGGGSGCTEKHLEPFPPRRQAARAAGPKILEEERGQAVNPKGCFSEGSVAEDGDRLSWGVWEAQDPQMVF